MAEETTNLGWIDAESYANSPGGNDAPQVGHQEYERGSQAYGLANLGRLLSESASSPATADAESGAGLYEDIGEVWASALATAGSDGCFAVEYLGNGIVLAGGGSSTSQGSVYKSIDSGKTWREISVSASFEICQSICNLGGGVALAGFGLSTGDGDVYKTTDYGETWSLVYDTGSIEIIYAIEYLGNGVVVAGGGNNSGDGDIFRSTDSGDNWSVVYDGSSLGLEDVRCFTYCGNGVVLAGAGSGTGDGIVLRSTDDGQTWTNLTLGEETDILIALEYIGNGVVLAGTGASAGDGDVYRSVDFGLTWTKVDLGADYEIARCLKHLGGQVVLCGTGSDSGDSDLFKSTDGGLTWTKVEDITSSSVIAIEYLGNGVVLAGVNTGASDIYRSVLNSQEGEGAYHTNLREAATSAPPTDAELDTIFGAPADVGRGFNAFVQDTGGVVYQAISNGTNWFTFAGVQAV